MTCVESATKHQTGYLVYFIACYAVALASWFVLFTCFKVMTPAEVEQMRLEAEGNSH